MKASIELALRTREVYQLFERRINGNRLFIETILHQFNIIKYHCRQQHPQAQLSYQQMRQTIIGLTQHFTDESERLEALLAKKRCFSDKKICFVIQFRPTIIVTNSLTISLVEFLLVYDKLMAILKLLHLTGCIESDEVYFSNIKRFQKIANQMLSSLLFLPAKINQ